MIKITQKGDFRNTERFFNKAKNYNISDILHKYGEEGVRALASATPVRTGLTASSWDYEIEYNNQSATIRWVNNNINQNVNIALILQYGHGTGTGGYVEGIDYINPTTQIIFEKIAEEAWKEVTK